ncbi:S8 family serine peptidase [Yoonia sp. 2307UL14-13]|uniref:S8 family serine peptidase n=1 Tax=Yoonia sp. 2307UL14-13 TaxID=3126506 RepID=UPI0030ACA343
MTWGKSSGIFFGENRAYANPYADWDRETRNPEVVTTKKKDEWYPVYIRLVANSRSPHPYCRAAARVIMALTPGQSNLPGDEKLAIDMISVFFLAQTLDATNARFASFFVWRQSGRAYDHVDGVFEVVHVGPASAVLCDPFVAPEKQKSRKKRKAPKKSDVTLRNVIRAISRAATTSQLSNGDPRVITAVVDDQIGFANERFRRSEHETRMIGHFVHQQESFLEALKEEFSLIHIGGIFPPDTINSLLRTEDEVEIYRKVDEKAASGLGDVGVEILKELIKFFFDPLLEKGFVPLREHRASHGTFISDIAAGHGIDSDVKGTRPILTFDLSRLSTGDTSGARLDVHSVMAVMFMTGVTPFLEGAGNAPIVINFSYALRAGPKDGTGFAEAEMARLVRDRHESGAPTWLILPSGNGFREQCHASLSPKAFKREQVEWRIQPDDQTPSYVEIWTDPIEGGVISIKPPGYGAQLIEVKVEDEVWDLCVDGKPLARVFRQDVKGRVRITIAVAPTSKPDRPDAAAPSGAWVIEAYAEQDGFAVHLDVQRDDTPDGFPRYGRQSYFDGPNIGAVDRDTMDYTAPMQASEPVQREYTLSSYGTANDDQVLAVGGAIEQDTLTRAALYTASGPGLGGRSAPEVSAVSEETRIHTGRIGAGLYSGSTTAFSGTSTAAALVTRQIVDALSEDPTLDKSALIAAVLEKGSSGSAPDLRLGLGTAPFEKEPGRTARRTRI